MTDASDVIDAASPTPTPTRARRAMGTLQRVAGKVISLDGATAFSCFVGGAALEQLAPGLSKTLDPLMVRSTVHTGLLAVKSIPALPALRAIGARLEARAQARLDRAAAAQASLPTDVSTESSTPVVATARKAGRGLR